MPGKIRLEDSKSGKERKSSSKQHINQASSVKQESQRVKTEKSVEERRTRKYLEEPIGQRFGEEKISKYSELVLPDSKKVSLAEEKLTDVLPSKKRSSKKHHKDGSTSRHKGELPLPEIDDYNYESKASSKQEVDTTASTDNYEDDYEDDFEQDYQDDFEDDVDVAEDKQAANSSPTTPSPPPSRPSIKSKSPIREGLEDSNERKYGTYMADTTSQRFPRQSSHSNFGINFRSAVQRTSKLSRRAAEILRLVTMDVTRVDFFDFPVVSEYDMYIMSYGKTDRKQASTQTFDDGISREVQTDQINRSIKWTQWPAEGEDEECGEVQATDNNRRGKSKKDKILKNERLNIFIKEAGSAMLRLLQNLGETQHVGQLRKTGGKKKIESKFSATFGQKIGSFSSSAICSDDSYCLESVTFPPNSASYLISLHSPRERQIDFASPQKIAIWSTASIQTSEQSLPRVVVSTGVRVSSFAMEAGVAPELLFAGHVDGSLSVWDFRLVLSKTAASFRSAAVVATSSAAINTNDVHFSPLKCLLPLPLSTGSSLMESQAGLRCELLSLDESGLLVTWAVADLGTSNRIFNDDPAVTPGGRIRLLRSSYGNIKQSHSNVDVLMEPSCLMCHPVSSSSVLIGLISGDVLHVTRYGNRNGGGLGSGHPNIFARKYFSPVLNIQTFADTKAHQATNDITRAFLTITALGVSVYISSRSQPVMAFDTDPYRLTAGFPIPVVYTLSVTGLSSYHGIIGSIVALTTNSQVLVFQFGPKVNNQWSGPAADIPVPSSSRGSRQSTSASYMIMRPCTSVEDSAVTTAGTQFLVAVAQGSGSVDLYLSDNSEAIEQISSESPVSPRSPSKQFAGSSLTEFLSNFI